MSTAKPTEASSDPSWRERRVHHRVRVIFAEALEILRPLLTEGHEVSEFAMARVVRDRYGELDALEVAVLVTAVSRLRRSGRLATP